MLLHLRPIGVAGKRGSTLVTKGDLSRKLYDHDIGTLGPRTTELTTEVVDGILIHLLSTEHFVRQKMLSATDKVLVLSKKQRSDFKSVPMM